MKTIALLALSVIIGAVSRAGADGMLDPSFGNGGLVTTNFGGGQPTDLGHSLVVLPDGRAVAAGKTGSVQGQMAAARYLSSGALDSTFSGNGLVAVPPVLPGCAAGQSPWGDGARSVLLQPDGRLVLVGTCPDMAGPVFWLVRLNVDGSLDPSFGSGGQVFTPFPGGAAATAGLLQPDGRIVAVGWFTGGPDALKAARYNPDGSLDPSFGTGGTLTLPLAQDFHVEDAVLQADGKLVIAGTYGPSPGGPLDFGLVRLLPNGALDPSFDGDGLVTSNFGAPEAVVSVIVLGDGRLVLGGTTTLASNDFALVRYLADGTLDTSFGIGGLAVADAHGDDIAGQLVELPNGKLLVAGDTTPLRDGPPVGRDFLLARFHADGALDTSFGMHGFIQTDFGSLGDSCDAVVIAGPDLILTAGTTSPIQRLGDLADFALARYIATIPVELLAFEVE